MGLENYWSLKGAVFIFGKLCAVVALYCAFQTAETLKSRPEEEDPQLSIAGDSSAHPHVNPANASYSEITNSNIFGARKADAAQANKAVAPTTLNLKLVAVNEASDGTKLAIIEDSKNQSQDVFSINDQIFGLGKLAEVTRDSVKIDRGGRLEVLTIADGGPASTPGVPDANQTEFSVADEEITAALANLPQLLSQARAVPYFRNGASIGMRLFAIRQDSLYEKLGLKNGDIILSVNENSLSDPAQALKLFEQLKTERAINVKLERNSQVSDMHYSIR